MKESDVDKADWERMVGGFKRRRTEIELRLRYGVKGVPILSNNEIDRHAEDLIADYDPNLLSQPKALDLEDFWENYLCF